MSVVSNNSPTPTDPTSSDLGRKGEVCLPTTHSWSTFWAQVASLAKIEMGAIDINQDVKAASKHYFTSAIATAASPGINELSEEEFQQRCLGYLKVLANKVTLENTSDGVKDFSLVEENASGRSYFGADDVAGRFRKLTFVTTDKSRRPDITIRLFKETDSNINTITPSPKLDSHRIIPWSTISFIELKRPAVTLERHVNQAYDYCDSLLRISPDRKIAFCGLTNLKTIIFTAAFIDDSSIPPSTLFVRTNAMNSSISNCLSEFVSTNPDQLGFQDNVHRVTSRFPLYAALGRGSTAAVIMINPPLRDRFHVLKISRDVEALNIELVLTRRIIEYMEVNNHTHLIPSIPKCHHERGSWWLLQEVVYSPLVSLPNYEDILQLWNLLKIVHRAGVVHRDIRRPNIGKIRGHIALIDWSSATCFNDKTLQLPSRPGSRSTASIPVLKRMDSMPGKGNYDCSTVDEVISLIYLALQSCPLLQSNSVIQQHPFHSQQAEINWKVALTFLDSHIAAEDRGVISNNIDVLQRNSELDEDVKEIILSQCLRIIYPI